MPTYEYKCPKCGRVEEHNMSWELIKQEVSEILICPKCHVTLEKQILPPNIIFKGKGFHDSSD